MTAFPQKGGESRKLDRKALPPPGPEHLLAKQAGNSAVPSARASLSAMPSLPSGDALHDEILAIFKRTSLSGPISTILTVLSWVCAGIYMCGALPCPVCA